VEKKRVNSCVLKQVLLEGVEQPKISPKKPGNFLQRATNVTVSKLRSDAAKRKPRSAQFFETALRTV